MILSLTRKFGSLLRGKATPFQLISACVLGALIGFAPAPGFERGLLLMPMWIALLVVLNANLFLAGLVAAVSKTLSLALLPVSFAAGRWVLDGPLQGAMASLIGGPITAWMGLEYYTTAGGVLVALVLGAGLGAGAVVGLGRFRLVMTKAEEGSPKFQKISKNKAMRFASWVLFGKRKAKMTYRELIDRHKKVGLPIRPLGVAAVLMLGVVVGLLSLLLQGPLVKALATAGLERLNGATVDLEQVTIDQTGGSIELVGLAFADPDDLDSDWLRAARLSATVDTRDLLRKRFVLDQAEMHELLFDVPRDRRGALVRPAPKVEAPPPSDTPPAEAEPKSEIEKWLDTAEQWKARLERYQKWIERFRDLTGPGDPEGAGEEDEDDRLKRWADNLGYANVRASHLVQDAPRFLIRRLTASGIPLDELPEGQSLGVELTNLSTDPGVLEAGPSIRVFSSAQTVDLSLRLDSLASSALQDVVDAKVDRWPLRPDAKLGPLLLGESFSASVDGLFNEDALDLTLDLRPHDAALSISGNRLPLGEQALPVQIAGSLAAPSVDLNLDQVARSLGASVAETGRRALDDARGRAEQRLEQERRKLQERLSEEAGAGLGEAVGEAASGLLDDTAGGLLDRRTLREDPLTNLLPPGIAPRPRAESEPEDEGGASE
ncbi:MAG: hypothetical protein AAF288_09705 [Planctomycetota bacterium]